MEWSYALSGLSRVHSEQMAMRNPQIFGLFGSASALSCVGMYGVFSLCRAVLYKESRFIFGMLSILYLVTIVLSHQRTTLIFAVILFAFAFRRIFSTILIYGCTFSVY
jgi:hypothetical protein